VKAGQPVTLTWAERIQAATTKTELSVIWREASQAGEWTKDLEALGHWRLAQVKELAG
jgi:hypothetical protein